MKVYIGPYKDYLTTAKIDEFLEKINVHENTREYICGKIQAIFYQVWNRWATKRKVKVKIHDYDTWGMDNTLAFIVLPMLKQLKETTNGAPYVELSDAPTHLHPPKEEVPEYDDHVDSLFFERWNWVLDEMIFSFESYFDDWREGFFHGNYDIYFEKVDDTGDSEMKHGPNHTFTIDRDGMQEYQNRIDNGFRLFGKYYQVLWD
jgi:hypothetical protein